MFKNSYIEGLTSARKWERENAERVTKQLRENATITDGVVRWNTNNQVPPEDIVEFAAYIGMPVDVEKSKAAREKDNDEFFKRYRERQANLTEEQRAERAFEMRAAFGPGEKVVDIITGETFET